MKKTYSEMEMDELLEEYKHLCDAHQTVSTKEFRRMNRYMKKFGRKVEWCYLHPVLYSCCFDLESVTSFGLMAVGSLLVVICSLLLMIVLISML